MPLPPGYPPEVVTDEPGTVDRCPVLTRTRAFVADEGVRCTLSFTFRDRRTGRAVDLSSYDGGSVVLRAVEALTPAAPGCNPIREVDGDFDDAAAGRVVAPLPATLVAAPGLFRLSFGVKDDAGELVRAGAALLSVEPTLFGAAPGEKLGPPTLGAIRMALRDSAGTENLLLREQEFGDDQVLAALARPIAYWNEQPPHIGTWDASNFPFREMWLRATIARLYDMAAAGYRRDHMPYQGAGLTIDDKNKEREYLQAAAALDEEWRGFVLNTKIAINHALFVGAVSSPYEYGLGRL